MTVILISLAAFLSLNYFGALALEVVLLSIMKGDANIGLYYRIGCHMITLGLAFPAFLLINRTSISKVKSLFLLDRKLPNLTLAGSALLLSILTVTTLLAIRAMIPDARISPPDIISGVWLVVITPVVEEILFRGVILKRLKKHGMITAVLITSALFSIGHLNEMNMFISFLPGIVLAVIAFKTDSIAYTVPLHMFVNLCGSVVLPVILSGTLL